MSDIVNCKTVVGQKLQELDCRNGPGFLCCLDKQIGNSSVWSRKCCEEHEYVIQNFGLLSALVVTATLVFLLLVTITLTSIGTVMINKPQAATR